MKNMIIDFHTHIFPPDFNADRSLLLSEEQDFRGIYSSPHAKTVGVKELIDYMDKEEIQRSVIFGFPWSKEKNYKHHNDYIIESIDRYPDRLAGFCCFSPLASGIAVECERCLQAGLAGVGELALYGSDLTQDFISYINDVMELCLKYDAPLLLHTNEPVGHEYPGKAPMTLRQIYRFIKAYSENRIILAHWGGGIFFYSLMKKEVKEALKNVWFDTAASPFLYSPEIYRIAGKLIGFDKILFGTDYPLLRAKRYFREIDALALAKGQMAQIKGLNAAKLLGLLSSNR